MEYENENEDEEIENLKQKIIKDLEYNPTDGINIFESVLLGDEKDQISFSEYLKRLKKTLKLCTCQASWMNHTLAIRCDDCKKDGNSCICVHCFLKGNHQGHKVIVTHSINGTCDCGDPILWSPSGFCCDHPGPEPNPELTQLDRNTRVKLISISKAVFHYYLDFASFNKAFFVNVTDWLIQLVSLGDATRRCVCIAMRDSFEFIDLYSHCLNFEKTETTKLLEFLGSLTNDQVFRDYFSSSFLRFLPKFIWINNRVALENTDLKEPPLLSLSQLFGFTFHATTSFTVQKLIRNCEIDWTKILNESLRLIISYCFSQMSKKYNECSRRYAAFIKIFSIFKSAFEVYGSTNPEIIGFVENLAEVFVSKEFSYPFTRVFGEKQDDPKKTQDVIFSIYNEMFRFVSKISSREIYTTRPLELMKRFFDSPVFRSIDKDYKTNRKSETKDPKSGEESSKQEENSNPKETNSLNEAEENDDDTGIEKVPSNSIDLNGLYYRSVLSKDVQIAQSFPTHLLAFLCLNLKEEKKTLYDYISNVTDDVEEFIRNWALIPLRWAAASDLSEYQLFVRNTQDALVAMHSFKFRKNIKLKVAPLFAFLQALMKITNDVDSFLLMIISTYGFFDQGFEADENEKQSADKIKGKENQLDDDRERLLLMTIFHFISCLIFDTLCKEKNYFTMRRLFVMSQLMEGNLSLDEINSFWYSNVLSDDKFCDDLQSFASKVKTKDETKFHLTDASEWHPLLPFMTLPSIIPLIQNFINKNPDSLINFPKLPQENERYLFSPTLWALEYHILSHKACKDYQIIQQLIFNVLIIASNSSNDFYMKRETVFDDDDSVLYATDFLDLISKLKHLRFDQFLRKKIVYSLNQSDEENAMSLVDFINGLGNIGVTVLGRMNLSDIVDNSLFEDGGLQMMERKQKNHERANKLKMQIMSNFNEKQKMFKITTSQADEAAEDVENFECGVCHLENKEDFFVFPVLAYKSPLSSYIKWRFRKAQLIDSRTNYDNENEEEEEEGREANNNKNDGNINDFSDMPSSFDLFTTVRICLHPIHSQCIHNDQFACPTDRCPRNAALPIIAGTYDYKPITNDAVLKGVRNFVVKAYRNDVKYAVYSLASEIEILEMRHRSNPGCLDNVTVAAALRNIYLCLWHSMKENVQKVLYEEEIRRRRTVVLKALRNEMIKKNDTRLGKNDDNDDDGIDFTWSQLKEKLKKYRNDLPDINDKKSIDVNAKAILDVLLPSDKEAVKKPQTNRKRRSQAIGNCLSILHQLIADFEYQRSMQARNLGRNLDQLLAQNADIEQGVRLNPNNRRRIGNNGLGNARAIIISNGNIRNIGNINNIGAIGNIGNIGNNNNNNNNNGNSDNDENENENNEEESGLEFVDDSELLEYAYEMSFNDDGELVQKKGVDFSPLMKYILYSMDRDGEDSFGFNLSMQDFINGQIKPAVTIEQDIVLKGSKPDEDAKDDDDDDDDDDDMIEFRFFNDTDTINNLKSDYQMLQFLRCAAIFDHFARGNKITSNDDDNGNENSTIYKNENEFIDWDVILSSSYLHDHYGIQKDDDESGDASHKVMQLPMFSFVNVPQNYLDFVHPPYSAPILTSDDGNVALCLLTGKVVLINSELPIAEDKKYVKLENFLRNCFKKSFDILLPLNGNAASQVIVASHEFNILMPLYPFYVDKFGDKDVGMKRGSLLYLSNSKREEIIDNFLSGSWTNSFKWQNM